MNRKCPVCTKEYDDGGDTWKNICYDCYSNYKFLIDYNKNGKRVKSIGWKADVYLSHPNMTKEEMDEWIKTSGKERGWGVKEWKPEDWSKFRVWVNSTNYD